MPAEGIHALLLPIFLPRAVTAAGNGLVQVVRPLFARALGCSDTQSGFVAAAGPLGRMISNVPAGLLAEALGHTVGMALGSFIIGCGSLLTAAATGFYVLWLGTLIMGVGESVFNISTQAHIRNAVASGLHGRTLSLLAAIPRWATVVSPVAGSALATRHGWPAPFLVLTARRRASRHCCRFATLTWRQRPQAAAWCASAVVLSSAGGSAGAAGGGGAWLGGSPPPPQRSGGPAGGGGGGWWAAAGGGAGGGAHAAAAAVRLNLARLRRGRGAAAMLSTTLRRHWHSLATGGVAVAVLNVLRSVRALYVPLQGADAGLSSVQVGWAVTLCFAVDSLLIVPSGVAMDRLSRKATAVPAFLLLSGGVAAIPWAGTAGRLAAVSVLLGAGNGLSAGISGTLAADFSPPAPATGAFLGVWRVITDSGSMVGPVIGGALKQGVGLARAALAVGAAGLAGAAWLLFVVPDTTPPGVGGGLLPLYHVGGGGGGSGHGAAADAGGGEAPAGGAGGDGRSGGRDGRVSWALSQVQHAAARLSGTSGWLPGQAAWQPRRSWRAQPVRRSASWAGDRLLRA